MIKCLLRRSWFILVISLLLFSSFVYQLETAAKPKPNASSSGPVKIENIIGGGSSRVNPDLIKLVYDDHRSYSEKNYVTDALKAVVDRITKQSEKDGFTKIIGQTDLYSQDQFPKIAFESDVANERALNFLSKNIQKPPLVINTLPEYQSLVDAAALDNSGSSLAPDELVASSLVQQIKAADDRFVVIFGHNPKSSDFQLESHDGKYRLDWLELSSKLSPEDQQRVIIYACRSACFPNNAGGMSKRFDQLDAEKAFLSLSRAQRVGDLFQSFAVGDNMFVLRAVPDLATEGKLIVVGGLLNEGNWRVVVSATAALTLSSDSSYDDEDEDKPATESKSNWPVRKIQASETELIRFIDAQISPSLESKCAAIASHHREYFKKKNALNILPLCNQKNKIRDLMRYMCLSAIDSADSSFWQYDFIDLGASTELTDGRGIKKFIGGCARSFKYFARAKSHLFPYAKKAREIEKFNRSGMSLGLILAVSYLAMAVAEAKNLLYRSARKMLFILASFFLFFSQSGWLLFGFWVAAICLRDLRERNEFG